MEIDKARVAELADQLRQAMKQHWECYPHDKEGWMAANDRISVIRNELNPMLVGNSHVGNDAILALADKAVNA